ncbi:MAG: caspase family protein [Deltaproteobacteria bacterium]|nr:caspase family protein [Deltaproteobacteria bacterium]
MRTIAVMHTFLMSISTSLSVLTCTLSCTLTCALQTEARAQGENGEAKFAGPLAEAEAEAEAKSSSQASIESRKPTLASSRGKRLALVVGVDTFADAGWPSLEFATKDARDVKKALEKDFDEVRVIDGIATKGRVEAALAELADANTSDLDTVVVYFSTHGTLAYDDRGRLVQVLVFEDTTYASPLRTGLTYEALTTALDGMRATQKLVVLAACHSGAGKSKLNASLAQELRGLKAPFFAEPPPASGEGQVILAATAFGETAREDRRLANDIYTHFLLEALDRPYDLDGDGAVTALEAHDYARRQTMAFTGGKQRPTLTAEIIGADPVVLRGRRVRHGRPMIAALGNVFSGTRLEIDGVEKGVLPGAFIVNPGPHEVRVTRPESETPLLKVNVDADGTVLLDNLMRRDTPPTWSVRAAGGYVFMRGGVGENYLPGQYMVGIGARLSLDERVRIGATVAGTHMNQQIRVDSAEGRAVAVEQRLSLVAVSSDVSLSLYADAHLDLLASVHLGWTYGRRAVELDGLRNKEQVVSFPFGGLGAELVFWFTETLGVGAEGALYLMLPEIDGQVRPTASDRYLLSLTARI